MTCESGIFITPLKIKQYCTTHAQRFEYYSKSSENEWKNISERLTCLQAALIATMKMFLNKWESWPFSKIRKLSNCWKVETWEMSVYYSTLMQEKHFDIFRWKYWLHLLELGASWLSSVQKVSRCNLPSPFASM